MQFHKFLLYSFLHFAQLIHSGRTHNERKMPASNLAKNDRNLCYISLMNTSSAPIEIQRTHSNQTKTGIHINCANINKYRYVSFE